MRFSLLLLIPFLLFGNSLDKELQNLSPKQKEVFVWIYKEADKYDLKWTMLAIAWQESNFGKYMIGKYSPDYGIFQVNIYSFLNRYPDFRKIVKKERVKQLLVENRTLNFIAALEEILFWKGIYGNNWNKIWASYNGGHKGNIKYSNKIRERIKALKRYLSKNDIIVHDQIITAN